MDELARDEIELIIMNQRAMRKSVQIEIKRHEIKIKNYQQTLKDIDNKIKENEERLADLNKTQSPEASKK